MAVRELRVRIGISRAGAWAIVLSSLVSDWLLDRALRIFVKTEME